jgi:2'-5' RNA ligase
MFEPEPRHELRTGVSIILRDALAALEPHHRELHSVHAAAGIPLHITLLFPFIPRHRVSEADERTLENLFRSWEPLEFDLVSVASFPSIVYAVPSPDAGLRQLMSAVWKEFPEAPPYGGAFSDPPPHATIALVQDDEHADDVARKVEARVDHLWPLRCVAEDVSLMEEYEIGRWREARSFTLGEPVE